VTVTVPRTPRGQTGTVVRRADPFREIEDLSDRMDQLVEGLFGMVPATTAARMPTAADIEETEDAFIVDLDVPGVKPNDVRVEIRENELRVSGEIKERERKGILRRQTRRIGQFEHVVRLPNEVDPDRVEATLHDGVLSVRLGKSRSRQPKRVEVKPS
jgi:HSP20 family protein